MTRAEILEQYEVDKNGIILSPGKFENEMLYVPYFWDAAMNGDGEEQYDCDGCEHEGDNDKCQGCDIPTIISLFIIESDDIKEFPELAAYKSETIRVWESDQGFVYGTIMHTIMQ